MSLSQCLPRPRHPRSINKIMVLPKSYFSGSALSKRQELYPLFPPSPPGQLFLRRPPGMLSMHLNTALLAAISEALLLPCFLLTVVMSVSQTASS